MSNKPHHFALWITIVVGIGFMIAPLATQMFSRAPAGGNMIDDFAPFMSQAEIDQFRGYMDSIGLADAESVDGLRSDLVTWGAIASDDASGELAAVERLNETWPTIEADMTDLLDRMDANLGNYEAVASLPPFALFPWFFAIPGLILVVLAGYTLWLIRHGRQVRTHLWTLAVAGVAVILAPIVFQMFSRTPQGAEMINDFRPMMTRERVNDVQGYFVTMGAAEGQLRTGALPMAAEAGGVDVAEHYPAISALSANWPTIIGDFSPMIATMSNNVENFAGIDALPSFDLFPWFFAVPGALTTILAIVAIRRPDVYPVRPSKPESQKSMQRSMK